MNGDHVLCICGKMLKSQGKLYDNKITATVMSNLGVHKYMEKQGISVDVTGVGDRYVLESMLKTGSVLGGEQSGHMIFLDYTTTGDGVLSSLQFIKAIQASGKKVSEMGEEIVIYPQALVNAKVNPEYKKEAMDDSDVQARIAEVEKKLEGVGRRRQNSGTGKRNRTADSRNAGRGRYGRIESGCGIHRTADYREIWGEVVHEHSRIKQSYLSGHHPDAGRL